LWRPENAVFSADFADSGTTIPVGGYRGADGGHYATTIGHLADWLVWQTTRVSLLKELERPRPPHLA
jgi:hypothetical protein